MVALPPVAKMVVTQVIIMMTGKVMVMAATW